MTKRSVSIGTLVVLGLLVLAHIHRYEVVEAFEESDASGIVVWDRSLL
jgi:hypothetical protein